MNFRKLMWFSILGIFIVGCSRNDDLSSTEEDSNTPDFIVVGEDSENIYQFNYNADRGEGDLINLTLENNIRLGYLELRQVNDLLTFYSFSSGSFSAVQRNVITGANTVIDNFYTVSGERTILWGSNSETKLFLGYFSPQGSTNYGVRIIDMNTAAEIDINIDFSVNIIFQPLYSNGKLFMTYRDNQDLNKVAIINAETKYPLKHPGFWPGHPKYIYRCHGRYSCGIGNK